MKRAPIRRGPVSFAAITLVICSGVQAQEPFVQIQAIVSRWQLSSETPTSLSTSAWGGDLRVTRWSGRLGIGAGFLGTPGTTGSVPGMFGLQVQAALRSSPAVPSPWRPQGRASFGLGVLRFSQYVKYAQAVCGPSGSCKGYPDFTPGWAPLLSVAAGFDVPLPLQTGVRGEGALDVPLRGSAFPGGGGSVYLRLGLGITLRM